MPPLLTLPELACIGIPHCIPAACAGNILLICYDPQAWARRQERRSPLMNGPCILPCNWRQYSNT